jgi:glutathione synthase/RimK-type ligase-like ATP-grasp enzyme
MILILTDETDTHTDYLEQRLRQRGAQFLRFDPGRFPSKVQLSLTYSATGAPQTQLSVGDERIDLESVKSVWFRRPTPSVAHDEVADEVARNYIAQECKLFMHDAWNAMDCFWLPAPPPVIRKAEYKASQLRLAGSLGFELPPTLFTNNPEDFIDFYQQHNGNVISKIPSSSLYGFIGTQFNRYTQVVSKRDLVHARGIELCPMIFQAYVPKRVELRITVVGKDVFAAEIHSQHSNHTRHDWRRYDRYQTPYFEHDLPRHLQNLCVRLVERLGLCYGAIDMVLTPDGRYVFLEINPNGQYLWIEQMTGLPISDAICDLLISGAGRHQAARQEVGAGA